jgi:hypothetical protein
MKFYAAVSSDQAKRIAKTAALTAIGRFLRHLD